MYLLKTKTEHVVGHIHIFSHGVNVVPFRL